jgi:hypothetical protein
VLVLCGMSSFAVLRRLALVRNDVSEERIASISVERIRELGIALAFTYSQRASVASYC